MASKQKSTFSQVSPDNDIDFTIWTLLNQSRDSVYRIRQNELAEYGVTAMETNALFHILNTKGNPTAAEIGRRMFREHPTVSALLERMERDGLITRFRDREKKNIWRIRITEKGHNAYDQSIKRKSLHIAMDVISENDKQLLCSWLKRIRDRALGQLTTGPTLSYP